MRPDTLGARIGYALVVIGTWALITVGMKKEHLIVKPWEADGQSILLLAVLIFQMLILLLLLFPPRR